MTIIDFHNHFYPPEYLEALRRGPTSARIWTDDDGNPVIGYPGDYNIVVPGHRDIAYRETVLAQAGVDRQVLTFTTPGTHIEPPDRAVALRAWSTTPSPRSPARARSDSRRSGPCRSTTRAPRSPNSSG